MSVLDLNGVGDAAERRRLHDQVNQLIRNTNYAIVLSLSFAIAVAAVTLLSTRWFPMSNQWLRMAIAMITGSVGGIVLAQPLLRRARTRAMVQLLRCEVRCIACGYPLKGSAGTTCPECGAPRPFPMTAQSDSAASQPAAREHRCTICGYPMVGLTETTCPECGSTAERS